MLVGLESAQCRPVRKHVIDGVLIIAQIDKNLKLLQYLNKNSISYEISNYSEFREGVRKYSKVKCLKILNKQLINIGLKPVELLKNLIVNIHDFDQKVCDEALKTYLTKYNEIVITDGQHHPIIRKIAAVPSCEKLVFIPEGATNWFANFDSNKSIIIPDSDKIVRGFSSKFDLDNYFSIENKKNHFVLGYQTSIIDERSILSKMYINFFKLFFFSKKKKIIFLNHELYQKAFVNRLNHVDQIRKARFLTELLNHLDESKY